MQRFEKREFAYPLKHLNSAYFVNFIFEADSQLIDKLRAKLKLDEDVALQNYLHCLRKDKRLRQQHRRSNGQPEQSHAHRERHP